MKLQPPLAGPVLSRGGRRLPPAIRHAAGGLRRKNDTIFVATEFLPWAGKSTPAWFLSAHDLDLLRWYFAAEPVEARAWGRREVLVKRGVDTYDLIQAQVKFSSGAIATVESAWIYPNTFPSIVDSFVEVIGSDGHIHFDRKRESIEISSPKGFTYPKNFLNAEIFGRPRGAFPACLEDFAMAILENREPVVTAFDGRQVTAALVAIHRSLESGANEPVAPPPALERHAPGRHRPAAVLLRPHDRGRSVLRAVHEERRSVFRRRKETALVAGRRELSDVVT